MTNIKYRNNGIKRSSQPAACIDRQIDRERDRERERYAYIYIYRERERQIDRQIDIATVI